eukprot:272948-Rhodomonas_salina.1
MLRATSRFASQRMRNASYVPTTLGTSTAFGRAISLGPTLTHEDSPDAVPEDGSPCSGFGHLLWQTPVRHDKNSTRRHQELVTDR